MDLLGEKRGPQVSFLPPSPPFSNAQLPLALYTEDLQAAERRTRVWRLEAGRCPCPGFLWELCALFSPLRPTPRCKSKHEHVVPDTEDEPTTKKKPSGQMGHPKEELSSIATSIAVSAPILEPHHSSRRNTSPHLPSTHNNGQREPYQHDPAHRNPTRRDAAQHASAQPQPHSAPCDAAFLGRTYPADIDITKLTPDYLALAYALIRYFLGVDRRWSGDGKRRSSHRCRRSTAFLLDYKIGCALTLHAAQGDAATRMSQGPEPMRTQSVDYAELPVDRAPLGNPGSADADDKTDGEAYDETDAFVSAGTVEGS